MNGLKPKVAFVCVHNSCRSQMAEAISKKIASDEYDAFSAGTEIKSHIDENVVAVIKEFYDVDMTKTQYPKLLSNIPPIDVLITMGCNVNCPSLPCTHREDWGLEDPSGKGKSEYIKLAKIIEQKVLELKSNINTLSRYDKTPSS